MTITTAQADTFANNNAYPNKQVPIMDAKFDINSNSYENLRDEMKRFSSAADTPASTSSASSFFEGVKGKAAEVVQNALTMIGVRYRWGGNTPDSGLDCSGFVRYVFRDALGLNLPRTAEGMSHFGEKISLDNLKPGDLVFFNTMRRTFSHVGIYIGDDKFVHSPSTGNTIRVDNLTSHYWSKRFTGARRLDFFS